MSSFWCWLSHGVLFSISNNFQNFSTILTKRSLENVRRNWRAVMTFPLQLIGRNWKAKEQTRKGTAWLGKEITRPSLLKEGITQQIILSSWGHCFFCPSVLHRSLSLYNGLTHMLPFPYERLDTACESGSSQKKHHAPLVKTFSLETNIYKTHLKAKHL